MRQDSRRRTRRTAIGAVLLITFGFGMADWLSTEPGVLKSLLYGAGNLKVGSEPAGARVLLDGRLVGVTPLELGAVLTGEHKLLIRHIYHPPYLETLQVERGLSYVINPHLEPAYGSLLLASNPVGATVSINGEPLDEVTPLGLPELLAGTHEVTFTIFGREQITRDVEVLPNSNTDLVVELNRVDTGALTVNPHPSWAAIKLLDAPVKYEPGVRLPTGDYLIEVRATGYETQTRSQKLRLGVNVIDITLQRAIANLDIRANPPDARITVRVGNDANVSAYKTGMTLLVGPIEIRAYKKGYRRFFRQIDLSPSGRRLNLTLEKFDATAGQHIRDAFLDGTGRAPEVVVIGEGTATLRSDTVTVSEPYAIGVNEVTVGEYRAFTTATGIRLPKVKGADSDEHPIAKVTWLDAVAYTQWLTRQTGKIYRLPDDAEWSYATYSGLTENGLCEVGNVADQSLRRVFRQWETESCDDGHVRSAAVRSFKPNELGLYDLRGNVSEWMRDCGYTCESHLTRGSAWDSVGEEVLLDFRETPVEAGDTRGMRVVREL